jgi:signal peptidase II
MEQLLRTYKTLVRRDLERGFGIFVVAVVGIVLVIDQLSKLVVRRTLGPGADSQSWEVAHLPFSVRYAENRGIAFSLLDGYPVLSTVLAILALGFIVVFVVRSLAPTRLTALGFGLVVGGALGNLIDRLRAGFVVDFVSVWRWPAFNVADVAITVGIILLILQGLRQEPDSGSVREQTPVSSNSTVLNE